MQSEICPRCGEVVFEVAPAEPDVGIFSVLLVCKKDGQYFFDWLNGPRGEFVFLDDGRSDDA